MEYFPFNLIDYAKTQNPPLVFDFAEFKINSQAIALLEHLNYSYWQASPWRETYELGLVIRDKNFNALNDPQGKVDNLLDFFKSISNISIDDTYSIIGINIINEGQGFEDEYFYQLFTLEIFVKNKTKM